MLRYFGWILGLYIGIWIVGFKIAVPLFFVLFLKVEGRAGWLLTILLTAISTYLILFHFERLLSVYWPEYLLERWLSALPGL